MNIGHSEKLNFSQLIPGIISLVQRMPKILSAFIRSNYAKEPIGAVIEKSAVIYSTNTAVVCEDKAYTYQEFNEAVNRYANFFLSKGVRKGDAAVVLLENRPQLLMIIGALAKIGVISSLVNTKHVGSSLIHSIQISHAKIMVVGEEVIENFEDIRNHDAIKEDHPLFYVSDKKQRPLPQGFIDLDYESRNSSVLNPKTPEPITIRDPYAYIFTSGTTGLPKAAILSHQRWVFASYFVGKGILNLNQKDRQYVCIPLCHTVGNLFGWAAAVGSGAGVIIGRRFSASSFWNEIEKQKATTFIYVGEICRYLLNQPPKDTDITNTVHTIMGNGLRPEIYKEFKNRFDIPKVVEFYGATEGTTGYINILNVDCTIGMSFFKNYIVKYDIENNRPVRDDDGFFVKCKTGEPGLLLGRIGGKIPFEGYTDRTATQDKIIRDAFKKGDAWFNTGDLVMRIGYGHAKFVDRIGDTFRWKSENVSTFEVERTLNQVAGIQESAVYGVNILGTDGRAGMAAVKIDRENFDICGLYRQMNRSLPKYAIPLFVRITDEFHTTATHKLMKSILQKEGFDVHTISDPVYVQLPGSTEYVLLTSQLYDKISKGEVRY